MPNRNEMRYPYRPLRQAAKGLRIPCVRSAQPENAIECSLRTNSLKDTSCAYETISNRWDDAARQSEQNIDGYKVALPDSAASTLRRMRKTKGEARLLSIDAVCIIQGDLEERGQQVLCMRDTYAGAACNLVYLGEPDKTTEVAVRTTETLYDETRDETDDFKTLGSTVADPNRRNACRSEMGFCAPQALDIPALEMFFSRPWFR